MTVGVDVGGTFTDVARWDGHRLLTDKVPTTHDQSVAVAQGVGAVSDATDQFLLHGTTVATNALLERRGARTILITNAGFEDLIEIGRQDRPSLYDSMDDRPQPLVDRNERIGWQMGADLGQLLAEHTPESVAIALLDSFVDGGPERLLGEQVRKLLPSAVVSLSHEVSGEFREYERIATTVLNAYLQPPVASYLRSLEERMRERIEHVLVMRSNGGLSPAAAASELAASIVLSGPAAGVISAAACGQAHGWSRVVSFDMGGTSTDVCRIENGVPEIGNERSIAGMTCRMPSVAVHTIGAGGGSIGWRDAGGALRVGPHSAGAWPGPASYGRGGTSPTITDAHLIAGRLGAERSLAGHVQLDVDPARRAINVLAQMLGVDDLGAARGMLTVVDALMERAIRSVTIEQGADPRQSPLLAFGGAGGLHASSLARRLDMPAVLIPPHSGVFSALGLLLSPTRHDLTRTVMLKEGDDSLQGRVSGFVNEASTAFTTAMGALPDRVEVWADLRYRGQSHETTVAFAAGQGWSVLSSRFHHAHEAINGFSRPGEPVELVTLRTTAITDPLLSWQSIPIAPPQGELSLGERKLPDGTWAQRVWRPALTPGDELIGPTAIEDLEATSWIQAGERAQVLDDSTIEITW